MSRKTWFALVKEYFPEATNKECDFILWEKTTFPMADIRTIRRQLKEYQQELEAYRNNAQY